MSSWSFRRRNVNIGFASPAGKPHRPLSRSPATYRLGQRSSAAWSALGAVTVVASAVATIVLVTHGSSSVATKNRPLKSGTADVSAAVAKSRVALSRAGGGKNHARKRRMELEEDARMAELEEEEARMAELEEEAKMKAAEMEALPDLGDAMYKAMMDAEGRGVGPDKERAGAAAKGDSSHIMVESDAASSNSDVGLAGQHRNVGKDARTDPIALKVDAAAAVDDAAPRCPAGSRVPAVDERYLHSMFTRLSSDPAFAHFGPSVVSRGSSTSGGGGPWALVLDNFLSPSELRVAMEHLRSSDSQKKFGISGLSGANGGKRNYKYRRSETMSCSGPCLREPWISPLVERMAEVVGLEMHHAEDISLTHYGEGGFYGKHHDYILEETNANSWRNCGNRILTFLVYLNDVEEGGATSFFHLGLDVEPKPGRALIFPNVFPDRPREKDERTAHEAKIVTKGEKFIAQTWFFLYDYQANQKAKCCI